MRHTCLCSGDIRLELFMEKSAVYAVIDVAGDREPRRPVPVDLEAWGRVPAGDAVHVAGNGWQCTITGRGELVEVDVWRDGFSRKRCALTADAYREALAKVTARTKTFMA
jgi:hypothetical protein